MKYKPPSFKKGECLTIQLADGNYAAALVLADDEQHCSQDFDCCLLAVLNYKENHMPTLEDFREANVLVFTHSSWKGQRVIRWMAPLVNRAMKKHMVVVGAIEGNDNIGDFRNIDAHGFWGNIFQSLEMQKSHESQQH